MAVRLFVLASVLAACGGSYGGKARPKNPGTGGAPTGGIERAALPYSVLDARTGRQVDTAQFWAQVAASRVVCVGEEHNNPHHHWFQLETVKQLVALKKTPLALGMEMFQRPFQGVLDDYGARRIDAAALRTRAGYEERWGYEYGFYGPTIDLARDAGATLLALNAPKELTKAVVRKGVDGLDPDEKKQLPELVLDDQVHRTWFESIMEDMGGGHTHNPHKKKEDAAPESEAPPPTESAPAMPSMDRIYSAQVVWDETMADGAATWAKAAPTGSLVLLAGNGHCHDSAIVGRVRRRGVDKVISVRPVIDTEGRVSSELAKPQTDFLIVLEMPKP